MIILGLISTIIYYTLLITLFIISTPFCLLAWLITSPFDKLRKVPHSINYFISRIVIFMNPYWRISVKGRENIDPNETYVITSNHQSLVDILLLYQLYPLQFKFVSKKELVYIPFIGWVMSLAKYVLLDRRNPKSQFQMMRTCEHYLEKGMSIGIFPEGTRSKTGELNRFKDGAFLLAKTTNSKVLPLCIKGNTEAMPKKGFIWKKVAKVSIEILPAISPGNFDKTRELTQAVRESINNSLVSTL